MMNELKWQTTRTAPVEMWRYVRSKTTARKLQLLSCAIGRMIAPHFHRPEYLHIIETTESYAEGEIDFETFQTSARLAAHLHRSLQHPDAQSSAVAHNPIEEAMTLAVLAVVGSPVDDALRRTMDWVEATFIRAAEHRQRRQARNKAQALICDLFREVFGNPFAPTQVLPTWLPNPAPADYLQVPEIVQQVARTILKERRFDHLPILADALEDHAIGEDALLLHLRSDQPHVLGCWALDILAGR